MEIYSYVGGSVAPKLDNSYTYYTPVTFKRNVQNDIAKSNIILSLWLFLTVCLMAFSVFLAKNISIFMEENAKAHLTRFVFVEDIDTVMQNFALNKLDDFDSQGNILDKNGKPLSMSDLFKEPVSYKNYTVKKGDTIGSICLKFGLSNISTLIAVNNISNVRTLQAGQKLKVPSMDGLIHTVAKNQSLASIGAKYNVAMEDLLDVNELVEQDLQIGQTLFIPGAILDNTTLKQAMGELFIMPLSVKFRYSSMFGTRADPFTGVTTTHKGIDMACPQGTPIRACCGGTVAMTSYSNLYGNYVIINHGNGYQTLYGHMSKKVAKAGQVVSQGQLIGYVGSTGYSTGPHLHLSVYKNNKVIDPLTVLKTK